jgi:hypothetical protein
VDTKKLQLVELAADIHAGFSLDKCRSYEIQLEMQILQACGYETAKHERGYRQRKAGARWQAMYRPLWFIQDTFRLVRNTLPGWGLRLDVRPDSAHCRMYPINQPEMKPIAMVRGQDKPYAICGALITVLIKNYGKIQLP